MVTGIVGGLVAGALPMTAVIVRSATNVQAGARTRLSRVLHGGWLLAFTVAAPAALGVIPVTPWDVSDIHVDVRESDGPVEIRLTGNATFLRLPRLLDTLDAIPDERPVELDLSGLRHLDHACRTALVSWAARHRDTPVRVT